ncbi:MAG: hypothetical protein ACR2FU_04125 [Streptosporangiaceae bacterium]
MSRRRRYLTKTAALGTGLAVAGLIAGTANAWLQHQLTAGDTTSSRWSWLLRRTLPAIGATMGGFLVLLLSARWMVQAITPASKATGPRFTAPPGSWILGADTGVSRRAGRRREGWRPR